MTDPPRPPDQPQPDQPQAERTAAWPLPAAPHASKLGRDYLRRHASHLRSDVLAAASIATSELIINAVQHGRPEITLDITVDASALRVVVSDAGPDLPPRNATLPPPDSIRGRGLFIIDSLVTAWGVNPLEHRPGKSVWFQLALA